MSEDISDRAWPEHVTIYTVRDETGEEYTATYGTFVLGVSYYAIRTVEDHVERIKLKIKDNEKIIENTQKENNLLLEKMKELLGEETSSTEQKPSDLGFQCPKGKTAFTYKVGCISKINP